MQTVLDKSGRIVIPKGVRDSFGLRPGSPIRIEERENGILLIPVESEPYLIEKDGVLVFTGKAVEDLTRMPRISDRQSGSASSVLGEMPERRNCSD